MIVRDDSFGSFSCDVSLGQFCNDSFGLFPATPVWAGYCDDSSWRGLARSPVMLSLVGPAMIVLDLLPAPLF